MKTTSGVPARASSLQGLPPILPDGPIRALVLGSFPSAASLESGQYYGHAQNRFWRVLAHCQVLADHAAAYPERVASVRSHGLAICDLYSRVRRQGCGDDRIRDAEPNAVGALLAERGPFPILLNGRFAREWRQHFGELPADGRAAVDQPPGAALEHARVPLGGAQRMVHRRQRSWLGSAAVIRSSSAFKSAATSTGNAARFSSGQVDTRLVPTAYQLPVLFHRAHIPRIPAVDQRHHQIYHVLADRGSQDQLPAPPLPLFNNSPTPGLLPSYHASMGPFIACAPPRFCCQAAPAYSPLPN